MAGLEAWGGGMAGATVILAPGACGGGVRAAAADTVSAGSAGSGGEFPEARFCAQAWYLRHICWELGVPCRKMVSDAVF